MMFSSSKENQLPLSGNNGSLNVNQISDKGCYSLRSRHNSQNIFKCEICSKIFDSNSSLEQHMFSVHHSTNGVFLCEFCSTNFSQKSSLMQHRCTHLTNTTSQAILDTGFPQKIYQSLTDNSNINTVKMSQNFTCEFCHKTFKTNSALLIHNRSHTGESPYSCEFCGKNFRQTAHLDVHMRIHTGETPFKCNYCNKSFNQKNNRNRHELIHLNGNIEQNPTISGINFDPNAATSPIHTSSVPNTSQSFTVSDVKESSLTPSISTDQSRSNDLIVQRTPQTSHICHLCNKTLNSKSALQVHYRTHTGESPYICHICNQRFKQSAHLDAHLRVHSKETPFKCQYCDKGFSQKGNKNRHERTHFLNKEGDTGKVNTLLPSTREVCHTNSIIGCEFETLLDHEGVRININYKQFVNIDADNVYSDKSNLAICEFCQSPIKDCTCAATHSSSFRQNTEPYPFQKTTEQFVLSDNTSREAVENQTAEATNIQKYNNSRSKLSAQTICNDNTCMSASSELLNSNTSSRNHSSFICKMCTKEFVTNIELQRHMQCHKGVTVCEFCHKDFKSSSSLAVHRRVHTGEMPYKCDYCNKSFKQVPHLDVHMRTHTGEMPFQCLYCDKKFSQKCNRNRHMNTHMNEAATESKDKCDKNEVYSGNQVEKLQSLTECTCGNEFSEPNSFITHILSHDNLPDLLSQSNSHNNHTPEINCNNSGTASIKDSQCRVCNETFTDQAGLDQHIASSHRKNSFPVSKDNCETEANKIQERPLGLIPGEIPYISSSANNSLVVLNNNMSTLGHLGNESSKSFQPNNCNIEVQSRSQSGELLYEAGYIENSQNKESKTNNWIEAASLKTSEHSISTNFVSNDMSYTPVERLGTHDCQICNSKFTNYTSFMDHQNSHNNCIEMMRKSQSASDEFIHNNSNFSDRGVFKCELCGKFFPDIASLHYHQQVKHSQEVIARNNFNQPRSCHQLENGDFEERDNSFTSSPSNKGHLITGSTNITSSNKEDLAGINNKLFSCKTCNFHFNSQQDLIKHKLCHTVSTNHSVKCNQDMTAALTPSNTCAAVADQMNKSDSPLVSTNSNICEFCKKDFRNHSALVIHRRIHTGEMPFQCEYCHRGFRQVAHLDVHLRIHTGETPYKCAFCSKKFSQNCNRIRHQKIHLQPQNLDGSYEQSASHQAGDHIYNCEFCISKFSNYEEFLDHLNCHNTPCLQDGQPEEYKKKRKLQSVSQSFYSENGTPEDWNCCERGLTGSNNKRKQCNPHSVNAGECNLQMGSNCDKTPLNGCSVSDCENNGGYFVKNCQNSLKVIGNNECELCSVQFVNKDELNVHQVSHHMDQPSTMFSNRNSTHCQSSMNLLKDSAGQGPSEKSCEFCQKTFNSTSALITHRRVHTGETPYKCSFCQKSFKQAAHRDVHMRIHTGETPYKCQYCDRSFSQNNNRLRHEKTHQLDNNTTTQSNENSPRAELQNDSNGATGSSAEQNGALCFTCPVCGALFENGLDLTDHQTICFAANDKLAHNDVDVPNCSVSLVLETDSFPNDDLQHIPSLSSDNNYSLKEADKSSYSDKNVSQPSEIFFSCHSCGIKFRTESVLNKHQKLCKGSSRLVPVATDDIGLISTVMSEDGSSHFTLKNNVEPSKAKQHDATVDLFPCNICGEEFTLAIHLNCHMATHSEQKEFTDHVTKQNKPRALSINLEEPSLHMTVEEFGNCSEDEGLATPQPDCSGHLENGEDSDNVAEREDNDEEQKDSSKQTHFKYKKNSQILDFENLIKKEILLEDYENPLHQLKKTFITKDSSKDTENPCGIDTAMETTSTCLPDADRTGYFCHQCNIEFTNEEKLHQHRISVHEEAKENYEVVTGAELLSTLCNRGDGNLLLDQHICEFCEKGFNSSSALHVHRRIHTGESPYKCHLCNRRFKQNIHLNVHLRTHTGETPYHCQFCDKKFTQNSNQIRHQRMHLADITTVDSSAVVDNITPSENNVSLEPNSDSRNRDSSDDHELMTNSEQQWKDKKPLYYNQLFEKERKSSVLNIIPLEYHPPNEPKIEVNNSDLTGSIYMGDSQQMSVLKEEIDAGDDKKLPVNTNNKQPADKEGSQSEVNLSFPKDSKYYLRNSHFRCDFCSRQFRSKSALIIHRRVHTGEKPYQCTYCLKSFKQVAHLETHSRIHTGETPFKCNYCRRSFSQKSNCDRHHRIHVAWKKRMKARAKAAAKTVHLCTICDGRFANASALSKHKCSKVISLEEAGGNTDNVLSSIPYSCNICGKNYINKGYFERHKQSHTLNTTSEKDATSVTEKAFYLCEICQQNFTDKTQYTEHVFQHISETPCDQEASSYTSTDDVPVDHIREVCYLCEQCKKEFYNKEDFYSHSCSSTFDSGNKERYEEHDSKSFENSCNDDEIFTTTLLDQDLSRETEVSGFSEQNGNNSGLSVCEFCNKTFKSLSSLLIHRRVHTGETPFKCPYCKRQFKQIAHLDVHLRTHTGETPFKCQFCDKSFTQNSNKNRHEKVHLSSETAAQLELSSSQIFSKNSVNSAVTTSEKPCQSYCCDICFAMFSTENDLNEHTQTHQDTSYDLGTTLLDLNQNSNKRHHQGENAESNQNQVPHGKSKRLSDTKKRCIMEVKGFLANEQELKPEVFNQNRLDDQSMTYDNFGENISCHQCEMCDKIFQTNDALVEHKFSEHITSASNQDIDDCNSKIIGSQKSVSANFDNGLQKHVCEYCNKDCKSFSSLLTHRRVHTGETPYKCSYCERSFKQSAHLDVHMRTHTGETPYKCKFCDKAFSQNSNKNRHERLHLIQTAT
ncbi:XP_036358059.1uncharacterized protein LOC115211127 isoform X1 [Octopus vulgaris]|uniref:XP_036358059.1uncharacterized protein LOC115211127 isoform X1 n=1 Tax=Octopus vulgaris TaxID=6645 RepID=A0AA36AST6_OCTVU|nr:XP_036358059.1uncharacterized protein LOC115211127 isoform X1 [Octopus vulgaris]